MKRIVLFTLLYGFLYTTSEQMGKCLAVPHLVTCIALLIYLIFLLEVIRKNGNRKEYKLFFVDTKAAVTLSLPLLLLPIANFATAVWMRSGFVLYLPFFETALQLISAFAEELLFRGALPVVLKKQYGLQKLTVPIIVSNVVFALLHFDVEKTNVMLGTVRVVFVFCVGFLFSAITERSGSIYPAIFIHVLINITSGNVLTKMSRIETLLWFVVSVLCLGYGMWIFHKEKFKEFAFNEIIH